MFEGKCCTEWIHHIHCSQESVPEWVFWQGSGVQNSPNWKWKWENETAARARISDEECLEVGESRDEGSRCVQQGWESGVSFRGLGEHVKHSLPMIQEKSHDVILLENEVPNLSPDEVLSVIKEEFIFTTPSPHLQAKSSWRYMGKKNHLCGVFEGESSRSEMGMAANCPASYHNLEGRLNYVGRITPSTYVRTVREIEPCPTPSKKKMKSRGWIIKNRLSMARQSFQALWSKGRRNVDWLI